ncbi:MAG: sugar ABC transporter substrate-binding protein [Candidatus Eremiobacteraeota bacterium]|nr:sugar ABC transporter substrate-binding protein [Candidatus Eremiobacteraeota bacterium]
MRSLLAAVILIVTCAASAARAADEVIAVFTKNQTNPFFTAERLGAEVAAKQSHARVIQYVPTQPDSIGEQMSQIDDVIVKKPAAVVLVPVDYKAMVPGVDRLNAANIPVVDATDRSAGGKFVAFIGGNDYELAKSTAERLFREMDGKGRVFVLEGVRGTLTNSDRLRGFHDAMQAHPNIKLLASQPANYQRLNGLQVTENLLQSFPDVDAVLAANDAMAIGAIDALEGEGRKTLVIGINGTKEAIDAIKTGKMLASGDYDGFQQGCLAVMTAIRYVRHEPIQPELVLHPVVIDRSNYGVFDKPTEQRRCPTWEEAIGH